MAAKSLPVLPLRNGVILPGTLTGVPVGRRTTRKLVASLSPGDEVLIVPQRDPAVQDPGLADLFEIGTVAIVRRIRSQGHIDHLMVEGQQRATLTAFDQTEPFLLATPELIAAEDRSGQAAEYSDALRGLIESALDDVPEEFAVVLKSLLDEDDIGRLADRTAATIGLAFDDELRVLTTLDLGARLELVTEFAATVKDRQEVARKIDTNVRESLGKNQREHLLREQLRAIQKELGDDDETGDGIEKRLAEKELPDDIRDVADKELKRLKTLQGAEQSVARTYLEWIADLPWTESADTDASLDDVQAKLDADHTGLDDVKKRILEHLAVRRLSGAGKATILALAGPPGVGKTSLGKSVADALGRPFVRVALGGVRDEAEIRGHRRTYVGARPGRLITGFKKAGVRNPVMLLDEIDKLGKGWAGDPESALLEVLDPEQNVSFTDHYLEVPFDLSDVLFICTANDLSQLSPPLRDRLEIIELNGYTIDEKTQIARAHLVPKALEKVGVDASLLTLSDAALEDVIENYTREAGVRQLTQQLGKIGRAIALNVARAPVDEVEGKKTSKRGVHLEVADLAEYLGKARFFRDVAERTQVPGVATGLAWTPVGGDILFIETSRMQGKGRVEITGQLGDVMKESARAAFTYIRSHADELGLEEFAFDETDVHIHVPAGGIPKDGPSAGVAMYTALTSLFVGRRVRHDVAMTGEVTLRGRVLPVGGIKSKVLAAHRAGIRQVVLPAQNERDIDELPEAVRRDLEIHLVSDMSEVLALTLEDDMPGLPDVTAPDITPDAGFGEAIA